MRRILIASCKGGCGKTTIATQLAVALARREHRVWLIDADPQGCSADWLQQRGDFAPAVGSLRSVDAGLASTSGWSLRVAPEVDTVIVDTPAGLRSASLSEFLRRCDTVLVPLLPSAIDTRVNAAFLRELAQLPAVRSGGLRVGLIANRLRPRTLSARQLQQDSAALPFPLVASLRDSQSYVLSAALGRGLFDYETPAVRACREDWQPLLEWLGLDRHQVAERSDAAPAVTTIPVADRVTA